ncbi:MAG: alpha/beta hydrolase [Anaerolineae bacterium]|nr:alpha/beta hydrolase [Anaerolineae bacterium]
MNTTELFDMTHRSKVWLALVTCVAVMVGAVVLAWLVQGDFGRIEVRNVVYENYNGIRVRAKLFRHREVTADVPGPGVVYIHGYQNNRETADPYCIELARRGIVALCIDAIGRGNSGLPGDENAPDFDPTYGGTTSFDYLKSLPFVDAERVGLMGHSLGAEMAYTAALADPTVKALSISGFAYTDAATAENPPNMLMIFGKWDEYRQRMTSTRDFEREWMQTTRTQRVIPVSNPQLGVTYGDFATGTARRVVMPRTIHILESYSRPAIAEAVTWMQQALQPSSILWRDPTQQTWPIKEWATLLAMLACFAALLPLTLILLRTPFFRTLQYAGTEVASDTGRPFLQSVIINGLLKWLYIPLVMVLFAIHIYVIPIDKVFPMMMVNGIVAWFVGSNLIGMWLNGFSGFNKKENRNSVKSAEIHWQKLGKTALLALILFAFAYGCEYLLEAIFIVDFRFIFPFASDLTPYRVLMFLLYFPFMLFGFLGTGMFLHGTIRRPHRATWAQTFTSWSLTNVLVQAIPLILFLMVQYVPLLVFNVVPLVGPGGVMATFIMNLFQIILVLAIMDIISTWCYQLTGNILLGALLNAALVAWIFASAQVIAPVPV